VLTATPTLAVRTGATGEAACGIAAAVSACRNRCDTAIAASTREDLGTAMVATGEAAMAVQVSAVLPAFEDAAKDPDVLAMFPFPGADDPEKVWIPAGVVVGFGVSSNAKDPEAAKAFLAFMGEEENLVKYSEIIGAIPLAPGASVDPVIESFVPYIEENRSVPFMDQQWPNPEVQPVHFSVVQRLLGGEIDVDRALREMDEAYQKS
jgi:raffinose/stachyose/melibiose transport system substrate-binding protein